MKRILFSLASALAVLGCSKPADPTIEVSLKANLLREQFATTHLTVSAPEGHRIRVMHDGRRTEEIEISGLPSDPGRGQAELFVIATLTPLPGGDETWLHWTAHLRSGGSALGGPAGTPRRVTATELADVFEVSVREGSHERGETVMASVSIDGDQYDFVIE